MKFLTEVDFKIFDPSEEGGDDEGNVIPAKRQLIKFRSRRFGILNTGDISDTLIQMANDIQTQIDKSYLYSSDIKLDKLDKNYNLL